MKRFNDDATRNDSRPTQKTASIESSRDESRARDRVSSRLARLNAGVFSLTTEIPAGAPATGFRG